MKKKILWTKILLAHFSLVLFTLSLKKVFKQALLLNKNFTGIDYEKHVISYLWNATVESNWFHPWFSNGVHVTHLISVLCCVSFALFIFILNIRSSIDCVSGLSIRRYTIYTVTVKLLKASHRRNSVSQAQFVLYKNGDNSNYCSTMFDLNGLCTCNTDTCLCVMQ